MEYSIRWPAGSSEINRKREIRQDSNAAKKINDRKVARLRQHYAMFEGSTTAGNHVRRIRRRRFDLEEGPVLATMVRKAQLATPGTISHKAEIIPHQRRRAPSQIMAAVHYEARICRLWTGLQLSGASHNQDR